MKSFSDSIAAERERLTGERNELISQRVALDTKIASIDRQFTAFNAYEAALNPPGSRRTRATGNGAAPQQPNEPTSRDKIITLLRGKPDGMTKADLTTSLPEVKETTLGVMLSRLIKSNIIVRDGNNYRLPATQ